MEYSQIDLYEFLAESELQHYYNAIKNELKITNAAQFKYATDEDLKNIGLSRPEIRRLRKFYEKYFPQGYISKIKRLLQAQTILVKREEGCSTPTHSAGSSNDAILSTKTTNSPSKTPNNKHIIPADSISVNKQLGTGEFGIVQQGVWTNGTERIQVAIKCLCRERMQSNPMEFLKEAAIMHSIEHENIVRLYGVVLATDSLMLVTELAHLRSLLECLKDSGLRVNFLTIPTLCEFAMQICNGMKYLENKRLIHRDLAARNILVFSKNKVKISDFGLSRALGVGKDYYKTNFNVNLKLPIAWCAPECINYLRFTNSSDVWAYGVCLWEMFSYGFQPWAALTGLQILEAIDAPNYQRLEQPDCCPSDYYNLMMKCWQDDPSKRPKFSEIYEMLPDMKPEQLKTVVSNLEPKKDNLLYRQGDIITVLDRNTSISYWKGVLSSGKVGFFNPSNTVAYLEGLPCSTRESFSRVSERSSKRKLRTEMISKPQNDLKHTGHVGIDGASFGDVAFLGNSQSYNHVPRQIVTPYKPSEDIEQTPLLLPPTPTSPDSLQTASGYFPEIGVNSMAASFISTTESTKFINAGQQPSTFEFNDTSLINCKYYSSTAVDAMNLPTNPFANKTENDPTISTTYALQTKNYSIDGKQGANNSPWKASSNNSDDPHEYHEISDDEINADKLDLGPSLLDEINSMFGSISAAISQQKSPDFEQVNKKNEVTEINSKLSRNTSSFGETTSNKANMPPILTSTKKKTAGIVKPISVKDEKILNQAIEIANEMSARSMNDLVTDAVTSTQSPKRKFSFRFPHLTNNGSIDKCNSIYAWSDRSNTGLGSTSPYSKKKNFTEELESIPDMQSIIGKEGRDAYNSLIDRKSAVGLMSLGLCPSASFFCHLDSNEFEKATSKTLPRRSMNFSKERDLCRTNLNDTIKTTDVHEATIPTQQAPRPMTLPNRNLQRKHKAGCIIPGKDDISLNGDDLSKTANENNMPCESPSYLINTSYKFPEQPNTVDNTQKKGFTTELNSVDDANPIPLPPRDGKKHIKTNPKRHVRKYPLIIPANGVQRTLNKVTEISTNDDEYNKNKLNGNINLQNAITHEIVASLRINNEINSPIKELFLNHSENSSHIYENIGEEKALDVQKDNNVSLTHIDSASLQFESILEADDNHGNMVLQSPDVTDGFYNFSIQKEQYTKKKMDFNTKEISGLYVNEDELRNLDIERNLKLNEPTTTTMLFKNRTNGSIMRNAKSKPSTVTPETNQSSKKNEEVSEAISNPLFNAISDEMTLENNDDTNLKKIFTARNELADNALFRKVRQSVDLAMDEDHCIGINSSTIDSVRLRNSLPLNIDSSINNNSTTRMNNQQTEGEYFAESITRLANSNSVSCEDLLEFSDKKPKGSERGIDSDEVRIMTKVLGKDITPERCLQVLEYIKWDVHKSIKIIKLQNLLREHINDELQTNVAHDALRKYEWDLFLTATKLRSTKICN